MLKVSAHNAVKGHGPFLDKEIWCGCEAAVSLLGTYCPIWPSQMRRMSTATEYIFLLFPVLHHFWSRKQLLQVLKFRRNQTIVFDECMKYAIHRMRNSHTDSKARWTRRKRESCFILRHFLAGYDAILKSVQTGISAPLGLSHERTRSFRYISGTKNINATERRKTELFQLRPTM